MARSGSATGDSGSGLAVVGPAGSNPAGCRGARRRARERLGASGRGTEAGRRRLRRLVREGLGHGGRDEGGRRGPRGRPWIRGPRGGDPARAHRGEPERRADHGARDHRGEGGRRRRQGARGVRGGASRAGASGEGRQAGGDAGQPCRARDVARAGLEGPPEPGGRVRARIEQARRILRRFHGLLLRVARGSTLRARSSAASTILARRVEARIRGLQRAARGLGHLDHRDLLELEEDEHRPLVVVEQRERLVEHDERAAALDLVLLRGLDACVGHGLDHLLAAPVRPPPVLGGDAQADAVEPGPQGAAAERGELAVDHDEDVLADVVGVGLGDPEPAQGAPHVRAVLLEHLLEHGRPGFPRAFEVDRRRSVHRHRTGWREGRVFIKETRPPRKNRRSPRPAPS